MLDSIKLKARGLSLRQGSMESFFLEGEAGRLEALLNLGQPEATHACVVCHPHPLYGGTMHNKVVFHAMKELNASDFRYCASISAGRRQRRRAR